MRYPLSPRGSLDNNNHGEGGRVSSLRSAWEGKSPKASPRRRTVLPSEIRSQEKSRAKQSWRSTAAAVAANGRENNTSAPAWRSTPDKRTPAKQQQQQGSLQSSSSPYTKHETSRSPGPTRLNSPGRIASPGTASKTLSAKSNDYIRKWETIGSPDAHASGVYRSSSLKETIGSSDPKTEVYRSQNEQQDSPTTLNMTYSMEDSIPPIKMSDTADSPSMNKLRTALDAASPSMNKLRNDLDTMSFLNDYKSAPNEEKKHEAVQADKKEVEEDEEEDDEESLYNIEHSVASNSNASSSLVYSLEDTLSSVRNSKESIRLKQTSSSASTSSYDGTESGSSAQLIASELIASTLAECRLLLQMSPPPTPVAVNSFVESRKKIETRDEVSDRAIEAAPSTDDSAASDTSVAKLMRCPCCSHKFEEAGEHEPLHSFACEHIICKDCVFQSFSVKCIPCPECGEKEAFDKTKPLVSRSYLRLIKKMGDSGSVKTRKNVERVQDSPMSIPSHINFGAYGKHANDDISVFSSVSCHIHTTNLANRYRDLAKQIDADGVSIPSPSSKIHPPSSVKSSFTINPIQEDVLSVMSESQCIPISKFRPSGNIDNSSGQETESVTSETQFGITSKSLTSQSSSSSDQVNNLQTSFDETSTMPPQEPSTPVSRAEFRFHQRKQRLAESLEKVNRVLEKSKNKTMGKICEEASVASSRYSTVEESPASVASCRIATSSVASSQVASFSVASSRSSAPSVASSRMSAPSVPPSRGATSVVSSKRSTTEESSYDELMSQAESSTAAYAASLSSVESMKSSTEVEITKSKPINVNDDIDVQPYQPKANLNKEDTRHRFKPQLRIDTGTQPFLLSVNDDQPSPTPMYNASVIEEETQFEKCSPCESVKSRHTAASAVSNFDPFGDDPFADHAFGDNNVFRGDNVPVVEFGNFFRDPTSSSDTEHEGAFLLPQQKDTKYKAPSQPAQKLTDTNPCAQFLPALDFSSNGFVVMDSPAASAKSGKNTKKRVKKKKRQYSNAKPQKKLTQQVFKSFGRSFDEASHTSGLGNKSNPSGNQDWRFQETLPKAPSKKSSDDEEDEFSDGSCSRSMSPSDAQMKSSLDALVTHKKGFRLKIRKKLKKKTGNKKH